ncbi:MAG: nucleotidyltransferase domain-containing protein [Candidatus Aenigmarchaeota archaeon]|nr:nucleotidyltransferase domain-containing protein [Candidatus Aenigmarchaeota archaeon]
MLQNYSRYKVLQEFFDFPRKSFQMRELSRMVKLAQPSVINHLEALQKEGLVIKEKRGIYPSFRANRESDDFKLLKKQNLAWRIYNCGLISFLDQELRPDCIVLFGSAARGEDTESSDIDMFIQAEETSLRLEKYERALNRKISLVFETKVTKLSKELLNNIINGDVLYGYMKVF